MSIVECTYSHITSSPRANSTVVINSSEYKVHASTAGLGIHAASTAVTMNIGECLAVCQQYIRYC